MSTVGIYIEYHGGVQYRGDIIIDKRGDILSTVGDIMSTLRDILSTVGQCLVPWGISSFEI